MQAAKKMLADVRPRTSGSTMVAPNHPSTTAGNAESPTAAMSMARPMRPAPSSRVKKAVPIPAVTPNAAPRLPIATVANIWAPRLETKRSGSGRCAPASAAVTRMQATASGASMTTTASVLAIAAKKRSHGLAMGASLLRLAAANLCLELHERVQEQRSVIVVHEVGARGHARSRREERDRGVQAPVLVVDADPHEGVQPVVHADVHHLAVVGLARVVVRIPGCSVQERLLVDDRVRSGSDVAEFGEVVVGDGSGVPDEQLTPNRVIVFPAGSSRGIVPEPHQPLDLRGEDRGELVACPHRSDRQVRVQRYVLLLVVIPEIVAVALQLDPASREEELRSRGERTVREHDELRVGHGRPVHRAWHVSKRGGAPRSGPPVCPKPNQPYALGHLNPKRPPL